MILQVASNILIGSDPVMENLPDDKIMGSSKKEVVFDSIFWQINLGDPGSEKKNTQLFDNPVIYFLDLREVVDNKCFFGQMTSYFTNLDVCEISGIPLLFTTISGDEPGTGNRYHSQPFPV